MESQHDLLETLLLYGIMKDIIPITSEKRAKTQKAVVLETRVVTGTGGGPEKTIFNTPRFMNPYGYPTLCAYMHPPGDPGFAVLCERAGRLGCSLISVPDKGFFDFSVKRRMLEFCREHNVTIWHAHDYKSNLLGLWIRRSHAMKLVTTVHGWVHNTWKTPLYYFLDRWCLRHYDHVICVSHDLYDECIRRGVRPERCTLVENAIDAKQFSRTMPIDAAKQMLGFPTDRIVLGACGRLSAEKNFSGLVRATAALLEKGYPLELYIIGEGPHREHLEEVIRQTGRQDHIHLLGFRDDISAIYQAMDIFVLSSSREGLPNVVLEAMAYELPVLSTRVAGVPRLITNGYNGVLVNIGDADELTRMLEMLAQEPDYRRMIGENARSTIVKSYNLGARMKKVRDVYDHLLGLEE